MMTPTTLVTLLLMTGAASAAQAPAIGASQLTIADSRSGRPFNVTIWYPTTDRGTPTILGESPIFTGSAAQIDASPATGKFPLIVLSHGSGSSVKAMSWLANALVRKGFFVAGPDHPGTTSGDSTPANTPKIWQRTADISALIDHLTHARQWNSVLNVDKIGMVGFSLGGTTAMELAGARARLEDYASFCDHYRQWDCNWFRGGVGYVNGERVAVEPFDLRSVDKVRFEQSNLEPRLKSAVFVDPGLAQAYDQASLGEIAIPTHYVNLGSQGEIPLPVIADRLAAATPNASYTTVAGANHFSFLPVCKPGAASVLKQVGEFDPICDEAGQRARSDIHRELIDVITEKLQRDLQP